MAQHVTRSQIKSGFSLGRRGEEELEMKEMKALGSKVGLPPGEGIRTDPQVLLKNVLDIANVLEASPRC